MSQGTQRVPSPRLRLYLRDEGTPLGGISALDVVGGGATATAVGDVGTLTIPQGAGVPDASSTVKGITKLSRDPAVPADPIAIGINGGALTGALNLPVSLLAVSGNVPATAMVVGVTSTAAPRTVTLPIALLVAGRLVIVKDQSGGAAANNITIDTEGAETIDGDTSFVININYGSVLLYSDGTNWFVIYAMGGAM